MRRKKTLQENYRLHCNGEDIIGISRIDTLFYVIEAIGCVVGQRWCVVSLATGEVLLEYEVDAHRALHVSILCKDVSFDRERLRFYDGRLLGEILVS